MTRWISYASLMAGRQHDDKLIREAPVWAAQNCDITSPVTTMAAHSQLTERGFHRRFKLAAGQTPIDYIQTLRIEEAKQLLEASSFRTAFRLLPIEKNGRPT